MNPKGGKGGHHLSGLLAFDSETLLGSRTWNLVINIPGLGERYFTWGEKQATPK